MRYRRRELDGDPFGNPCIKRNLRGGDDGELLQRHAPVLGIGNRPDEVCSRPPSAGSVDPASPCCVRTENFVLVDGFDLVRFIVLLALAVRVIVVEPQRVWLGKMARFA